MVDKVPAEEPLKPVFEVPEHMKTLFIDNKPIDRGDSCPDCGSIGVITAAVRLGKVHGKLSVDYPEGMSIPHTFFDPSVIKTFVPVMNAPTMTVVADFCPTCRKMFVMKVVPGTQAIRMEAPGINRQMRRHPSN